MKSTVETLGPTRVKLAVELPFDELKSSLDAAYKRIAQQVRVPGFRPGKVPARLIDQRIGRGAVLEEVMNEALPRAFSEAVSANAVKAIGRPDFEVTELKDGELVSFTAEVDVRPEISVPALDQVAVSVDEAAVSDSDVDGQLDELRGRFGTLRGVDRAVQVGDFVSIDMKASVDGEEVEGGSANNLSYEVGKGDLVDGLDDALVGKSADETVSFVTQLQHGERGGEQARVEVTIKSVKERELPAVDDDFAQLASEFDTIDDLKSDLRTRLGRVKVLEQGAQARDKVLEHLLERVEVPLPESVVTAEVENREHDIVHQLGHDDALFDKFLESQGTTREAFQADLRESAEKSVKGQLILDEIADREEVSVGDAELTEYLIRQARRYDMAPKEFADQIVQSGNLPSLLADVRRNKALALVLENASVTDTAGNKVDLAGPDLASSLLDADQATGYVDEHDHEGAEHAH